MCKKYLPRKKTACAVLFTLLLSLAGVTEAQQPIFVSTEPTNRNVIIETFTGRDCGYDPDAHRIANNLAANNPDRVWPINVHEGGWSPTSYPNLNTQVGHGIASGFNCNGYPTGVVNRSTSDVRSRNEWNSLTNTQLAQLAECNIAGVVSIDPVSRYAAITVEVYYTANSNWAENYLTIAMLQDSIFGDQADWGNYNPEQWADSQYVHMHTLRDIITENESIWGDPISPTTQGTLITRTYEYQIPESIGSPNGVEVDLNNIYFLAWVTETYRGTPTRPILNACKLMNAPNIYYIGVAANPSIGGTVSGAGFYDLDQTCTLSAVPYNYFEFLNWTENGEVVSTDETYSFTVTGSRSLVANFLLTNPNPIVFADPNVEAVCMSNWDFDGDGVLCYSEAASITDLGGVFQYNENITSFDELQYFTGLNAIGDYAFFRCKNLISLTIPENVVSIGYSAFYGCYNLSSITIPEEVVTIGSYAFCVCYNLTSVNIPGEIVSIGEYAFYICGLRGEITLPESLESVGGYAFYGCDGISTVNYNAINCQTMGYGAEPVFYDCAFTHLNIGENVQSIPNFAFKRCFMITDMTVAAVNPPIIYPSTFGMVPRSIPVSVPHGSGDAYSNALYWDEFFNINEIYFNDVQTVPLSQGWNWWSTNLDITLENLKAALVEALPGSNITIKSRTQNTAYNPNTHQWRGTLNALDVTQMYMIYVSTDCEITLTGTPINPAEHPVTISNGSNWIAFPLAESMTVSNAFAGFAINGDKVKSRNNNSQYIGGSWRGQLTTLVPGQGYMYISNSQEPRTFTFPASTTKSACLERKKD